MTLDELHDLHREFYTHLPLAYAKQMFAMQIKHHMGYASLLLVDTQGKTLEVL